MRGEMLWKKKRFSYIHTLHILKQTHILTRINVALFFSDSNKWTQRGQSCHWSVQWYENQYMWWNSTIQRQTGCCESDTENNIDMFPIWIMLFFFSFSFFFSLFSSCVESERMDGGWRWRVKGGEKEFTKHSRATTGLNRLLAWVLWDCF